jgi:hypothetical protein
MSAGFDIDGETFWGSNGAIEAYVEAMAEQSAQRFGPAHRWTAFFRGEREGFFPGKIVCLDAQVTDAESRAELVELLDLATEALNRRQLFTEVGKQWAAATIPRLRTRIQSGGAKAE